jgi:uncharacterized coiled-coil protein SlyX
MPKRLVNEIRLSELGNYQLWEEDAQGLPRSRHDLEPNSQAYFQWLATLPSLRFVGKEGHFTARREQRQRGNNYWFAYRRQGKQFCQYLGTTDKLTLTHLESTAKLLTELCSSQPMKTTTRKKPMARAVLLSRIAEKEKIIAERDQTIADLQSRLSEQEQKLDDLAYEYKKRTGKCINRNDIVRHLIDHCIIEELHNLE